MDKTMQNFFKFLKNVEKLKQEVRHSWTGNKNRQESVAEHSWLMSLMVIIFVSKLKSKKVDTLKALKMAIIHDLAEALTGDIPAQEISKRKEDKTKNEIKAIKKILKDLPFKDVRRELRNLWEEYEKGESNESKLVRMIDKTEVLVQHNISDISTWDETDYPLALYAKDYLSDFDDFTRAFKDALDIWTFTKISKESDINKLKKEDVKKFRRKNNKLKIA